VDIMNPPSTQQATLKAPTMLGTWKPCKGGPAVGQEMQKEHKNHPDTAVHLAPHLFFNTACIYK